MTQVAGDADGAGLRPIDLRLLASGPVHGARLRRLAPSFEAAGVDLAARWVDDPRLGVAWPAFAARP